MADRYPLFQSVLSSAPFGGTMADTSTPTPEGVSTQAPVKTAPPIQPSPEKMAQTLRLQAIDEEIASRTAMMKHVENQKWSRHPNDKSWVAAGLLGLNGNKDAEPQEMMYKRHADIVHLSDSISRLYEQRRIESQISPVDQAEAETIARESAKNLYDSGKLQAAGHVWDAVNAEYEAKTGLKLPIGSRATFQYNPQGGIPGLTGKGSETPEDLVKRAGEDARVGRELGPKGIRELLPPDRQLAAMRGYEVGAAESAAKKKEAVDAKRYAGFSSLAQLRLAVERERDNAAARYGTEVQVDTGNVDQNRNPIYRLVHKTTPEQEAEARQYALDRIPGASEVPEMQGYVTGQAAPAQVKDGQPSNENQGGLTPAKIKAIRDRLTAQAAKAP